jgi:cyclopropane-fatty-acyl-phospholipid synthase
VRERACHCDFNSDTFGRFDAVASLGAFEHFCSPEEYRGGRQDEVYRDFFARVATVLPDGGRLYLQTMVFGRNMVPIDTVSIQARQTPMPAA